MCASGVGEYNSVHNEIITVSCERSAGWVRIISLRENYSLLRQASSMVTTRCDAENLLFLATHCDRLRSSFIYPHSLYINGSNRVAPGETIRCPRFVLRHKVANTPSIALTQYRLCLVLAVVLGLTQNLHFTANGRQSHITILNTFYNSFLL